MEGLKRYRSKDEQRVYVERVTANEGQAIVGPVVRGRFGQTSRSRRAPSPTRLSDNHARTGRCRRRIPAGAGDSSRAGSKDRKAGRRSINARSEAVATNGMFKYAYRYRRALMPIDGHFERRP